MSTIPEKIPIIKLEEETVRYDSETITYIDRVFITKQGDGTKGIWQYAKSKDPNQVYLCIALIVKDPETQQLALVVKKERQLSTHEKVAIGSFYFGKIDDRTEDYQQEAVKRASELLGIEQLEVIDASPAAYYTDPWKSDERVKTVVIQALDPINFELLKQEGHFLLPLKGGVQGLIELAKKEGAAIDCDMYQLLYGLSLGFALLE